MADIQEVVVNLVKNHGKQSIIQFTGNAKMVWASTLASMLQGLGEVTTEKLKEVVTFKASKQFMQDLARRLPAALYQLNIAQ